MASSERQPEVIVDFIFDEGLFFVAVKNIGDGPAHDVSVVFNKKFTGVAGTRDISALPLFRKLSFLAPQREITTFLDHSVSYFRRRQPTALKATITFKDNSGTRHAAVVKHDLSIYKNLGYLRRPSEAARPLLPSGI